MIFITIGSQLPFDRLIRAVDQTAPQLKTDRVIAQVGNSNYTTKYIDSFSSFPPNEFNTYLSEAELIISHAGMGTIISALVLNKPIIVMPRLKKYGEVTTDHQLATAKELEKLHYIYVAYNEEELQYKLITTFKKGMSPLHKINKYASDQLVHSIETFINS